MKRVKWSDQFKIHLPEIDAEHRSLYRAAEALQAALLSGAGNERVAAIIQEAVTHIAGHFAHEERLMKASAFPGAAWHKEQHDAAVRRVLALDARVRGGDPDAPGELLDYLAKWLRDHIALADRMMGSHLRNWERAHTALAS